MDQALRFGLARNLRERMHAFADVVLNPRVFERVAFGAKSRQHRRQYARQVLQHAAGFDQPQLMSAGGKNQQ